MTINDKDIKRYELKVMKTITRIFLENEQTIILHLFKEMSANKTFPLKKINVENFLKYFLNNFLSEDKAIKYTENNINHNHLMFETNKYVANIWVETIKKNNSHINDNYIQVPPSTCTYSTPNTGIVNTENAHPTIDQYKKNKPNLIFILEFSEDVDNFFSSIRLACIPHGQLRELHDNGFIISKDSNHIGFNFDKFPDELWRHQILYRRLNSFASLDEIQEVNRIEQIEKKYLDKYYHFLKFTEDEMLFGFKTKEKIKGDWWEFYNNSKSDFAVGAERIIYSLLNGKGIGQPNSSPVGADLFFEVEDAYIHIDLKTVQLNNIGDYNTSIFVGTNQNSYRGEIIYNESKMKKQSIRDYKPSLPYYYLNGTPDKKVCLSYFVTILYDKENLNIYIISLLCMPNGLLEKVYGSIPLQAGKNKDKTRYCFSKTDNFISFEEEKRIKCIIRDDKKINSYTYPNDTKKRLNSKLAYYLSLDK